MLSRLILIRHGMTEGNKKGWFYGGIDIPLLEEGKEKLRKMRDRGVYPELPDDAQFFTTGLGRTEETLEVLFGKKDFGIIKNLREMEFGEAEGSTFDEMRKYDFFDEWIGTGGEDVAPPGGETKREFRARIEEGLKELLNHHRMKEWSHRHGGEDAVTVMICHGGVISAIMKDLFPDVYENMWSWMTKPGTGYMIDFKEGEPYMFNDISEIKKLGFGLMRLPEKDGKLDPEHTARMVDAFMEHGYTYFDTAFVYDKGQSEATIKTALVDRYPRDSYQLATKLAGYEASSKEEAEKQFETSLERTGAGYFDFYLLHNMGADRTACYDEFGLWDFVQQKKKEGKIKQVGFSIHDQAELMEELLTKHPEIDFVQLQINYVDWLDPSFDARRLYETCVKHYKPIVIMEPVKGGNLINLPEQARKILTDYDPNQSMASWALRFCMSLPGVITVLSGMSNIEQMEENLAIADDFAPLSDEEQKVLMQAAEAIRAIPNIPCTGCGYCTDGCPMNIPIPGIFRRTNMAKVFGNISGGRGGYNWETRNGNKASTCIECGECERVCPQKIKIINQLKEVVEMFE